MKVKYIQKFFKRFAELQVKYRFLFLTMLLLLSVVGITGLKKVKKTTDDLGWITQDAEHTKKVERFEELFGNNDTIALLIEAKDVFEPDVLKVIKSIGKELLEKVPYADTLMSITDVDITRGSEEGMEIFHPFEDGIPSNKDEIEDMRRLILSRKAIVNKLVSSDCTECWVILSLYPFPPDEEWQKTSTTPPMNQAGEAAIAIVTDAKWQSDKYTIKPVGLPYTETEEDIVMPQENMKTVAVSFIVMIILLILFAVSFRGVLVPLIASTVGIMVVFGLQGHIGITVDSNMMSLPVLLALALSVGYSIHLLNSFKHYFYISGKRKESVIQSIEETGWPLFFTVVTTVVSVLSFLTTSLEPIRWVGISCAMSVMAVYIYTSILLPIAMTFGKDKKIEKVEKSMPKVENIVKEEANVNLQTEGKEAKTDVTQNENTQDGKATTKSPTNTLFHRIDELFANFGKKVIKRRFIFLISFILIFLACIPGLLKMDVRMNSMTFMGTRIPYVKRIFEVTQSQLGSFFNYSVMITFPDDDAVKDPANLMRVEELENVIGSFNNTKKNEGVAKVFSVVSTIKEMNQTLNEDNPAYYKIPEDKNSLAQMLLLYEMSGGDASKWVDEEYKTLRIRAEVQEFDSRNLAETISKLREESKRIFPDADVFLVGAAVNFADLNEHIVFGELYSFIFSIVAIAILMALVFGSIKLGLIGLIPNIAPIIVIGAVMGYLGIPLDMMTMTIMPMILGIAVDDTIYFMTHAKLEFEDIADYDVTITNTFRSIGKTLGATTVILCASFVSYSVSLLDGIVRIGLLGALGLAVALVADYLMTPILIYMLKPFKK